MELILDDNQLQSIDFENGPVVVRDAAGRHVGTMTPIPRKADLTEEEVAKLIRRMSDPNPKWHTTEEVIAHLRSLDTQ